MHAPTVEDIKNTLEELYQEYKLKGEVAYDGKESEISKYSHREMARKFSEVLVYYALPSIYQHISEKLLPE